MTTATTTYALLTDCDQARGTVSAILDAEDYGRRRSEAERYADALRNSDRTDRRGMRTDRKLVATGLPLELGQRVWMAALASDPTTTIQPAA